ncbi:hypothetical protein AGLY_009279 [Aphis glycines]|uniref:Uncharacterized protein n=1 Tax=Aphis glycines TaxID=307491 RepID=A0A6G0THX0_APHGL|nr:hypothetical protein AGLY_009279 [Aphis glycines]
MHTYFINSIEVKRREQLVQFKTSNLLELDIIDLYLLCFCFFLMYHLTISKCHYDKTNTLTCSHYCQHYITTYVDFCSLDYTSDIANTDKDAERSDECIDFTVILTSRNNASISNFGGGFRWKSEYPVQIFTKSVMLVTIKNIDLFHLYNIIRHIHFFIELCLSTKLFAVIRINMAGVHYEQFRMYGKIIYTYMAIGLLFVPLLRFVACFFTMSKWSFTCISSKSLESASGLDAKSTMKLIASSRLSMRLVSLAGAVSSNHFSYSFCVSPT